MTNEFFILLLKAPSWEQVTALIQVLVWPITLVVCLALFRRYLADVISRVGSFKAGSSGLEMTFQNKLESIQALPALKPAEGISKSAGQIQIQGGGLGTPYEQLLELRDVLNNKLTNKAKELNIPSTNITSLALSDKLKEVGGLTIQQAKAFNALIDLTNTASPEITQSQVNQVRNLVNNLDI